MKSIIIASAALAFSGSAAIAGPYVNVETNSGFVGSDYSSTLLETHVGYEGEVGDATWYLQGGPAVVFPDNGDSTTELSGKAGIGAPITAKLSAYGEVAAITSQEIDFDADLDVNLKAGLKYSF